MKRGIQVHTTKRSTAKVRKDIRRAVKRARKQRLNMEKWVHTLPLGTRIIMAWRIIRGKPII